MIHLRALIIDKKASLLLVRREIFIIGRLTFIYSFCGADLIIPFLPRGIIAKVDRFCPRAAIVL